MITQKKRSRHIAGKIVAVDPLDAHWDETKKREKIEIEIDRIFLSLKVIIIGLQNLHIRFSAKNTLNSASKLNAS